MSESIAHALKWLCRVSLLAITGALVWLYMQSRSETLPFSTMDTLRLLLGIVACFGLSSLLSLYLMLLLGIDVLGLRRLTGAPTGKPFSGLEAGETERLRFDFTHGGIGRSRYRWVFKLLLTDKRLLVGVNLTSWFLLELPLARISGAQAGEGALHLELVEPAEAWTLTLGRAAELEALTEALTAGRRRRPPPDTHHDPR